MGEEEEESPWGSGKERGNLRRSSSTPDITQGHSSHHDGKMKKITAAYFVSVWFYFNLFQPLMIFTIEPSCLRRYLA